MVAVVACTSEEETIVVIAGVEACEAVDEAVAGEAVVEAHEKTILIIAITAVGVHAARSSKYTPPTSDGTITSLQNISATFGSHLIFYTVYAQA